MFLVIFYKGLEEYGDIIRQKEVFGNITESLCSYTDSPQSD